MGLTNCLVACSRADVVFELTILKTGSPQVAHFPWMVLLPFFMTSSTASTITFRSQHSEQYASVIYGRVMDFEPLTSPALRRLRDPSKFSQQVKNEIFSAVERYGLTVFSCSVRGESSIWKFLN